VAAGTLILALTIVCIAVCIGTLRAPSATLGRQALDRTTTAAHPGSDVLAVLIVGRGLATAAISGIDRPVFSASGGPLPPSPLIYPTRVAHGYIGAALAFLIAAPVGAVLYHQLGRQDGLLGRMAFGHRI